jgi:hypothetical protein
MSTPIDASGTLITAADGMIKDKISMTIIETAGTDPNADLVEIRTETKSGAVSTVRLSKAETEVFALLLSKVVDDCNVQWGLATTDGPSHWEGRSITRDELLKAMLPLPRNAEIDVQVGADHLAITGLVSAWGPGGGWFALQCNQLDVASLGLTSPQPS